ncbi:uncharacterized protein C2845_PM15G05710 [Panicum miliaceum]|uniref:Uncharacterized protein n=1 Tax=Panicum miliaceum TaxID=4540 RepID=A0A3L6QAP4_PANMI|nr:uncharacterized protein C2845_PM15G05710 [Panicum miliaceum]
MQLKLTSSNKGWHSLWFYLRNDSPTPFLEFTERMFDAQPSVWSYGPVKKGKKALVDLFKAISVLKDWGVRGAGVISAYHKRRVLPLMVRTRRLDEMIEGADLAGTVMSMEPLGDTKPCFHYKISRPPLLEDVAIHEANRLADVACKAKKDADVKKKKKKKQKMLAQLNRGKCRQGSDAEEDDEDDDKDDDDDDDDVYGGIDQEEDLGRRGLIEGIPPSE